MKNILVIGAGAWGGAIAQLLANNSTANINHSLEERNIFLYGNEPFDIKEKHKKLDIKLNEKIKYFESFKALESNWSEIDCIFLVIPSSALLDVAKQLKETFDSLAIIHNKNGKPFIKNMPIVLCSKGLDGQNNCLYSESLGKILKSEQSIEWEIGILSGPNFAKQVALGRPTVTNIAFQNLKTAKSIASICVNENFSARCITDVNGAQVLGAYKNVMALFMGIMEGSGYTSNSIAKYFADCMLEIKKLITLFKGNQETIFEPCGMGDIYLTCTNKESRNSSFGFHLGKHESFSKYCDANCIQFTDPKQLSITVEGVNAVNSLKHITNKHNIQLPSVEILYKIIFQDHIIKESINSILLD